MPEDASENDAGENGANGMPPYESPVVDDLQTIDGPAVTAAAKSES